MVDKLRDLIHETVELKAPLSHPHVAAIAHIPGNEPIFVLRAQDKFAIEVVEYWCVLAGREISNIKMKKALDDRNTMVEWQKQNPDKVKIPD